MYGRVSVWIRARVRKHSRETPLHRSLVVKHPRPVNRISREIRNSFFGTGKCAGIWRMKRISFANVRGYIIKRADN